MQITKTEYNAKLLKKWEVSKESEEKVNEKLQEYLKNFEGVFENSTQVKNFVIYIQGLLSKLERKSIEPIALEYMGTRGVRTLQNYLTRSTFEDETVQEEYQRQFAEQLSSANGMLSVDPSEFVKKGKNSAGVKRQYCGRLGKVENCQSVVFVAYAGERGYGIVDKELYIPNEWFDEEHEERRKKCGISNETEFKTKNEIALELIQKNVAKNTLNIKWIGCDGALGCDHDFVDALNEFSAHYFVSVPKDERVFLSGATAPTTIKALAENDDFQWEEVGFDTSKGIRNSDVKIIRANACRTNNKKKPVRHDEIWVYIRRLPNGDTKYFQTNAPADISQTELHEAATLRWPIEQCFEECKSYLGMADFEGRSYGGFMRHLLFVMIAHFFATSLRLELKKTAFP
jgi:SRSO17 transposase